MVFSVNFHFWCTSWSLTKVGFLREELECTVNQWFLQCMTLILDLLNRYTIISYKNKPHNRVRKTFTHATTHVSVCYCWCWILIPIYGKVCACMLLEKKPFFRKMFQKILAVLLIFSKLDFYLATVQIAILKKIKRH